MSFGGLTPITNTQYEPGVCNIGPAEITRRRRAGHVALAVSVALFAILLGLGAPHWMRLALFLTVGASASGYLQAYFHFCAGFGAKGVFNFGPVGTVVTVADEAARAKDKARSLYIGLASGAIGAAVAILAAMLPVR